MSLLHILLIIVGAFVIRLLQSKSIRNSALLVVSVFVIYWLQPLSPIRYLDFWLPTITLALIVLTWLATNQDGFDWKSNQQTLIVLGMLVIMVGVTRYFSLSGLITASRPPPTLQIVFGLIIIAALCVISILGQQKPEWTVTILIGLILVVFISIKSPYLSEVTSKILRTLSGQSIEMALPGDLRWLGFSYIAFRILHVLRDRQMNRLPVTTLQEYVIYVIFFPAFSAGPIDRIERFIEDLRNKSSELSVDLSSAGSRLLVGLFKKFALADSLALIAINPNNATRINDNFWAWLMVYAYAFQLYWDFSGYTDIAVGIAQIMGFRLPENFNRPYLKSNLTKFWNNWHMTLTQWFQSYFYFPVTRHLRRKYRKMPAWTVILITQLGTMVVIGLWHGITINFVIWGVWHGLGLFVQNRYSYWVKPFSRWLESRIILQASVRFLGVMITFHFVVLGWLWFVLPDPQTTIQVIKQLVF
jgi:alginate O-acetyltransferase complex protein AlgI